MMALTGKIIFAGGGTGGHVYPALACMETLQMKGNFEFLYVGGYRGIENRIIPKYHYRFKKIWISGFQRSLTFKNILFPLKLVISLLQSVFILLKFKPAVVVGTGGYVSGPVVYSAAKMGIPTLIHYPVPVHLQTGYEFLQYQPGEFPVTEKLAADILSLPIYPGMNHRQVEYVVETLSEICTP